MGRWWIGAVLAVGCDGLSPYREGVVACPAGSCVDGDGGATGDDTDVTPDTPPDDETPAADCPDPVDCDDPDCAEVCDADDDGFDDEAYGGDDCDDGDEDVHPAATEICDLFDNDCDGAIDDDDADVEATTWYLDGDGDGYGVQSTSQQACDPGSAPVSRVAGDCDDAAGGVNPGEAEVTCDGLNNDCGSDDDDPDGDSDGAGVCSDCDDTAPSRRPGAAETCGDGVDSDCDGQDCGGFRDDFEGSTQLGAWWNTYGAQPWSTNTAYARGSRSAASGDITHSQFSHMEVSATWSSAGTIAFWYRTDTESNYDFLVFYVDGNERGRWSGSTAWTRAQYNVSAGTHTLKWTYLKDISIDTGADRVWVDDIVGQ